MWTKFQKIRVDKFAYLTWNYSLIKSKVEVKVILCCSQKNSSLIWNTIKKNVIVKILIFIHCRGDKCILVSTRALHGAEIAKLARVARQAATDIGPALKRVWRRAWHEWDCRFYIYTHIGTCVWRQTEFSHNAFRSWYLKLD